jgi:hypothetical protein
MPRCLTVLSIAFAITSAEAARAPTAPALRLVQAVIISTPSGWSVVVGKSGPVMIGFGSNGSKFVPLPDCSFDFTQVYRALGAVLCHKPIKNARFQLTFVRPYSRGETTRYTDSAQTVRPIFEHARECLRSQTDKLWRARAHELEELWQSRPPVPERPNQALQATAQTAAFL